MCEPHSAEEPNCSKAFPSEACHEAPWVSDVGTLGQRAAEWQKGLEEMLPSPVEPNTRLPSVEEKERKISDAKVFKTIRTWQ